MKRDLSKVIHDLGGNPIKVGDNDATLKDALLVVVTAQQQDDAKMDVVRRMRLFDLAQRIYAGGEVELSSEDIVLLKARASSVVADIVMLGRIVEALESDPEVAE